jgi:D-psicose/D-tagatose/L-ribulose 3-epimerase
MNKDDLVKVLGVSSIAWAPEESADVAKVLAKAGIAFIDIAPTQFTTWGADDASAKLRDTRNFWNDHGLEIRGFQSLLFGAGDWNIFDPTSWPSLLGHFELVFDYAEVTGATKLVFGSPRNRLKGELSETDANEIALDFFSKLADSAAAKNLTILLEPNPKEYGCDFLTTTTEALVFAKSLDHLALRVQLDLGTCLYAGEDPVALTRDHEAYFGYVHLSTTELRALADEPNALIPRFVANYSGPLELTIEQRSGGSKSSVQVQQSLEWLM